jgi:hypothetical protein
MLTSSVLALLVLNGFQGTPVHHHRDGDSSIGLPSGLPFPPSIALLGKSNSNPLDSKIQNLVKKVDRSQAKKSTEYFPKVVYVLVFRTTDFNSLIWGIIDFLQ